MTKYIKFIGKLKDLKSMGYEFQHLYARNYQCWHKSVDAEGYGDTIWVWGKGKCVEFMDLHGWSHLILEEIIQKGRKGYRRLGKFSKYVIDKENDTLLDWKPELTIDYLFMNNKEPTDEEIRIQSRKYRVICIEDKFLNLVNELLDKDMIEVSER